MTDRTNSKQNLLKSSFFFIRDTDDDDNTKEDIKKYLRRKPDEEMESLEKKKRRKRMKNGEECEEYAHLTDDESTNNPGRKKDKKRRGIRSKIRQLARRSVSNSASVSEQQSVNEGGAPVEGFPHFTLSTQSKGFYECKCSAFVWPPNRLAHRCRFS